MSVQRAWLNAEFLQRILRKSENDESIEVTNVETKRATMDGDNYLGDMIRVSVEYLRDNSGCRETNKKSLIIKVAPTLSGDNPDLIANLGAYNIEIKMMEETLVKLSELLNEDEHRFGARILHSEIGSPTLIVMEDLASLDFIMADRHAGLDLEHCYLTIRKLAKLHASSIALWEKDPKSLDLYQRGSVWNDSPEEIRKMFLDGMRSFANEVRNWSELGSDAVFYCKQLLKLSKVCFDKSIECSESKVGGFNVLNHGDVWVNNMLFRYDDDGNVIDHIFVDFQVSSWSSPAVDITRFMNTAISEEVELHHTDELLQEYLKTLTETMSRLGCNAKPPSMADLEKMLKDNEIMAIIWSAIALPFVLLDKNQSISFSDALQKDKDYVNPGYKGLAFRKAMVRRLPIWNAHGLFSEI